MAGLRVRGAEVSCAHQVDLCTARGHEEGVRRSARNEAA